MAKLKSERHHWWPECLSRHWQNDDGCTHRLSPDGRDFASRPKNLGVIGNGHHIKLGSSPDQPSPWDESYEETFSRADSILPSVVDWLFGVMVSTLFLRSPVGSFAPVPVTDDQFYNLAEVLVSLAVRSPRTRETACGLAERISGPLSPSRRNAIIGLNNRHTHKNIMKAAGFRGKAVVVISPHREFIFGDGFFSNVRGSAKMSASGIKILVPLTPAISVLYVHPQSYFAEPRLSTLIISSREADVLNEAVQIYSGKEIFYRSEKPAVAEAFNSGTYAAYASYRNPIDCLIDRVPGVTPRDLDLYDQFEQIAGSLFKNSRV